MQSFSEIDTTSKRASRAVGFAWGIAEEIGKNMRNLEMFGLPGIKNLNQYYKIIKEKHLLIFLKNSYGDILKGICFNSLERIRTFNKSDSVKSLNKVSAKDSPKI